MAAGPEYNSSTKPRFLSVKESDAYGAVLAQQQSMYVMELKIVRTLQNLARSTTFPPTCMSVEHEQPKR